MAEQRTVGFVLFDKFELLDVFGPAEAYGARDLEGAFKVVLVARQGGPLASAQGPRAMAGFGFDDCPHLDLIVVPGGIGTRREVDNSHRAVVRLPTRRAGRDRDGIRMAS